MSGREDRWGEFGFDRYARERLWREVVGERCPLDRNGDCRWRHRECGYREAAAVVEAIWQVAGARRLRAIAAARHSGAYGVWGSGHARRHKLSRHSDQEC